MLARTSKLTCFKLFKTTLLFCVATALASCASKEAPLIADPGATQDSALPWNEQAKWERDGSAAGLNTAGRR